VGLRGVLALIVGAPADTSRVHHGLHMPTHPTSRSPGQGLNSQPAHLARVPHGLDAQTLAVHPSHHPA
jgi:hypothetical protein